MKEIFNSYLQIIKAMEIKDFFDIAIVALLLYVAIDFLRERRAGKLAAGVGMLVAFQFLCNLFNLTAVSFLLENLFQFGIIALFIVFQPELRSALEKVGGEPMKGIKSFTDAKNQTIITEAIKEICDAALKMSSDKTARGKATAQAADEALRLSAFQAGYRQAACLGIADRNPSHKTVLSADGKWKIPRRGESSAF